MRSQPGFLCGDFPSSKLVAYFGVRMILHELCCKPPPPPLPWPTAAAARSACPLSILHALNATACAPSAQPPARSRYTLLRSAPPPPPRRRRLRSPSLLLCCRALPVPSDQSECAQYDRKRPKYTLGASVALHAAAERWPLAAPHHAGRPAPSRRRVNEWEAW